MPKAAWAEWLMARLTDRGRAAAIIGDLLEANEERKPLLFWLSVAGIVVSLVWRNLIAFAATVVYNALLFGVALRMHFSGHIPPWSWTSAFSIFPLLSAIAPYALVRYGLRDRFTQLTLALYTLVAAATLYWWIPTLVLSSFMLLLSIVAYSASFAHWRKALLVLGGSLALGYAGKQFAFYLADWYTGQISTSVTCTVAVQRSLPFLQLAILAIACEVVHRSLVQRDQKYGASSVLL